MSLSTLALDTYAEMEPIHGLEIQSDIAAFAFEIFEQRELSETNGISRHDTTYDHFLHDFVGSPFFDIDPVTGERAYPSIEIEHPLYGLVSYTRRVLGNGSYGDNGTLLHIRVADKLLHDFPATNYFVATANVRTGETTTWCVTDVFKLDRGIGRAGDMVLLLSKEPLEDELMLPEAEAPADISALARGIWQRRHRKKIDRSRLMQPKIIMSSQGTRFDHNGEIESFSWLPPLCRYVDLLEARTDSARQVLASIHEVEDLAS